MATLGPPIWQNNVWSNTVWATGVWELTVGAGPAFSGGSVGTFGISIRGTGVYS